jgi:riboflavin kinase / FMN adenylyltransferase
MKREYGLEQIVRDGSSVVTVGTFDGVHIGHQAVLRYLVDRAREKGGSSVAVSFHPHPREVVHGESVPLLTTIDERAEFLAELEIDRFIVLPFTREFSRLPAESFIVDILVGRIGLQEIVIGYDHAFGQGRRGDRNMLEAFGRNHGFSVDVLPPQVVERHVVSSSEIRQLLLENGDVMAAAQMLGRPYTIRGKVVGGAGRGRAIGFPTANLAVDHPRKVIPRLGVYAVRVDREGEQYGGMMNVGRRPTFGDSDLQVEVHLFDFDGNLYGRELRIEFVERIREERKFPSAEALAEQLSQDRARCKRRLRDVSSA